MGICNDLAQNREKHCALGLQATHDVTAAALESVSSAAYFQAATAILIAQPSVSEADLSIELLERYYRLSGSIKVLSSEVERTAEVDVVDGRRLILKTSTRPEAIDSFRFQSSVLAKLEGAGAFISPQVIPTSDNRLFFKDDGVWGYLQTRLVGRPLHEVKATPELLYDIGSTLARLDVALARSDVAAMHRPVLWHIGCWSRLMKFASHLPSGPVAERVGFAMDAYENTIKPLLGDVAWQVTHNDPSPFNMLLTGNGVAFIDFGDGGWGPRIQDLAIAASHFVGDPSAALGGAEYLIAGYASVLPLSLVETKILVGLMRARQSALILVNYWRAQLFPAEAQYIKKNVARAENGLAILAGLDEVEAEKAILAATLMMPD